MKWFDFSVYSIASFGIVFSLVMSYRYSNLKWLNLRILANASLWSFDAVQTPTQKPYDKNMTENPPCHRIKSL